MFWLLSFELFWLLLDLHISIICSSIFPNLSFRHPPRKVSVDWINRWESSQISGKKADLLMQWKSASRAIKCHCDLAWDVSPSLKNAQWTMEKEDTFKCFNVSLMVRLVSLVVGLTFLSVVFKTSCLLCTDEYYSCFYKLYVIKFRSGFGGLSHHCLRDYFLWRQKQFFLLLRVI